MIASYERLGRVISVFIFFLCLVLFSKKYNAIFPYCWVIRQLHFPFYFLNSSIRGGSTDRHKKWETMHKLYITNPRQNGHSHLRGLHPIPAAGHILPCPHTCRGPQALPHSTQSDGGVSERVGRARTITTTSDLVCVRRHTDELASLPPSLTTWTWPLVPFPKHDTPQQFLVQIDTVVAFIISLLLLQVVKVLLVAIKNVPFENTNTNVNVTAALNIFILTWLMSLVTVLFFLQFYSEITCKTLNLK